MGSKTLEQKITVRKIYLATKPEEVKETLEEAKKLGKTVYVEVPRWKWLKVLDPKLCLLSDEEAAKRLGIEKIEPLELFKEKEIRKEDEVLISRKPVLSREVEEYKIKARGTKKFCPYREEEVTYEECLKRLLLPKKEELDELLKLAERDEIVRSALLSYLFPKNGTCALHQPDCVRKLWNIGEELIKLARFLEDNRKVFVESLLRLDDKLKKKLLKHYEILDVSRFLPGKEKRPRAQIDFQTEPLLYAKLVVRAAQEGTTMPREVVMLLKEYLEKVERE